MEPKVFISYSWSSSGHQEFVRGLADRLISDGVNVVLDQYDLKEGQDKIPFMEKMVVDETITHVLLLGGKDSLDTKKGHNKVDSFREIEYSIPGSLTA